MWSKSEITRILVDWERDPQEALGVRRAVGRAWRQQTGRRLRTRQSWSASGRTPRKTRRATQGERAGRLDFEAHRSHQLQRVALAHHAVAHDVVEGDSA